MGRSLNNEPESAITALLRLRYTLDDHAGLLKRRSELTRWFELFSPERSGRLYGRLVKKICRDELSSLFWKLAEERRLQMLAILKKKIEQHRTTRKQTPKRSTKTETATISPSSEVG